MPPALRGSTTGAATSDRLGSVLGEKPISSEPAGPWRVTARVSGGLVQISNNHESRVIRKAEVEAYLRKGKPW
jgi:hypothetical protein